MSGRDDRDAAAGMGTGEGAPVAHGRAERSSPPRLFHATLVTADERETVRVLHEEVGLSDAELALATGANQGTVRRWRSKSGSGAPRNREAIDDLRAIAGLLLNSGLVYPAEVGRFLRSRSPDLDYERPLEAIGREEFDRVRFAAEAMLERLAGLTPLGGEDKPDLSLPHDFDRVAPSQSNRDAEAEVDWADQSEVASLEAAYSHAAPTHGDAGADSSEAGT